MIKIILLSLSLIISFSLFANAEPTKKFGARYWHSEGETEMSHCASLQCGGAPLPQLLIMAFLIRHMVILLRN